MSSHLIKNVRIQQLAKQAGFYVTGDGRVHIPTVDEDITVCQTKFAELIVRECMGVAASQRDPANLNYKPSERFVEALEMHFGVKK